MDGLIKIQAPVKFNAFKHHKGYFLDFIKKDETGTILKYLNTMCNNYIDYYTGILEPEEICNEILTILKTLGHFEMEEFKKWISKPNGYELIKLHDNSEWILRMGDDPEFYIHIHPARSGESTIRIKGSTLKTAFAIKNYLYKDESLLNLVEINKARELVGLSPVKNINKNKGFFKCYKLFFCV